MLPVFCFTLKQVIENLKIEAALLFTAMRNRVVMLLVHAQFEVWRDLAEIADKLRITQHMWHGSDPAYTSL